MTGEGQCQELMRKGVSHRMTVLPSIASAAASTAVALCFAAVHLLLLQLESGQLQQI